MAMSVEEWNDLTRQIVAAGADQGQVTALLTQATQEFSELFVSNEENRKQAEQLTEDNQKLRQYNMDLFLQLGDQKRMQSSEQSGVGGERPRGETITVADLFKKEEN